MDNIFGNSAYFLNFDLCDQKLSTFLEKFQMALNFLYTMFRKVKMQVKINQFRPFVGLKYRIETFKFLGTYFSQHELAVNRYYYKQ